MSKGERLTSENERPQWKKQERTRIQYRNVQPKRRLHTDEERRVEAERITVRAMLST
jgi:hypothetical protein